MHISRSTTGKFTLIALGLAAALALPLSAAARGPGGYGGGWHGGHGGHVSQPYRGHYNRGHYRHGGYYHHGGYWSGGRWVAGAIVTGAMIGLIDSAVRPAPVVYAQPTTVVYRDAPVVRRRVVETRTVVVEEPYSTRYIRDDGWDGN